MRPPSPGHVSATAWNATANESAASPWYSRCTALNSSTSTRYASAPPAASTTSLRQSRRSTGPVNVPPRTTM